MYQVIKKYRDHEELRHSFNELAKKTFGIDFEDWYQNGYWTDRYDPHSIVIDGKVVANVSVNKTIFEVNGVQKNYIQLGTVMTEEAYRNQGMIRQIMVDIEQEYAGKIDGMYLFANDEVLSFYPKFGFETAKEYEYVREIKEPKKAVFEQVPMEDKAAWDRIEEKIKAFGAKSAFEMLDNSQLPMFYISKYMQENVFYSEKLDTYVVAEIEDGTAVISMVISEKEPDLDKIAEGFGKEVKQVILGFTPKNTQGFAQRERKEEDTTLFVKGDFAELEEEKLMFPVLAHA